MGQIRQFHRNSGFSRRGFLRGVGACLALPAFDSLASTAGAATKQVGGSGVAKNFVCVAPDYGIYPSGFFPAETGSDYKMPTLLKPLERMRSEMSVFSGLDHPGVSGGHGCSATLLNGANIKDVEGDRRRLFSLDQLISEQVGQGTRFKSLSTGKGAPISYTRTGTRNPTMASPKQVFEQLFVEDHAKVKVRKRQTVGEDQSILDAVLEDARSLKGALAKHDQQKLDEYLTSVREIEQKLTRRNQWLDVTKPKGKYPVSVDEDAGSDYPYDMSISFDLMVLALQTNSTRVITYQMPGGNRRFTLEGVTMGYHTLTHHGKQPHLAEQLQIIETYYTTQFARFLDRLKKTKSSEGKSLLDESIVMFSSGMGNASSHSSRNLPVVLAGGGFKHGQHHAFEKVGRSGTPLSNLYVTLLQQMGIERERFSTSKGDLNHLLT